MSTETARYKIFKRSIHVFENMKIRDNRHLTPPAMPRETCLYFFPAKIKSEMERVCFWGKFKASEKARKQRGGERLDRFWSEREFRWLKYQTFAVPEYPGSRQSIVRASDCVLGKESRGEVNGIDQREEREREKLPPLTAFGVSAGLSSIYYAVTYCRGLLLIHRKLTFNLLIRPYRSSPFVRDFFFRKYIFFIFLLQLYCAISYKKYFKK